MEWSWKEMNIAFIAHDKKKDEMVKLTTAYREIIKDHQIFATGTTGQRIIEATGLDVHRFKSGPLGGDQQIGAYVSDNKIDLVIFLRDPLTAQPHEPDISALLRLCDVYEIPLATNLGTSEILLRGLGNGFIEWRKTKREAQLEELKEYE
ncbi:methylglyoxal synthase [Carnobacterium sp. 17-4]|nr:methylglyoxal synthase [Carnobacterium sp. 17-4]